MAFLLSFCVTPRFHEVNHYKPACYWLQDSGLFIGHISEKTVKTFIASGTSSSGGHFSLSSEQKPSSRLGGARSRTVVPGAEPTEPAPAKTGRKRSKGKGKGGEADTNGMSKESEGAAGMNGLSSVQQGESAILAE